MDITSAVAVIAGSAGSVGAYFGGRYSARSQQSQIASDTVGMLSTQVETLRAQLDLLSKRCEEIPALHERIKYLEGLALQRAAVDEVIEIVNRIEAKISA